jgi:general secretion pathway protein G
MSIKSIRELQKENNKIFINLRGKKMRAKSGFTLVEILIVVVILGILAAIVIPQFTGASTEAKESALVSDLQAIRSQIELFKIQHNADILPGEILDAGTGAVTAATPDSFVNALTCRTDKNGVADVDGTGDASTYRFGPYMKKIPENPFSTSETVTVAGKAEGASSVSVGARLTSGGAAAGWNFVNVAGVDKGHFQAADSLANPLDETDLHVNY